MVMLGDQKIVLEDGAFRIVRKVSRLAYAKSGNAHNPTPTYSWLVFDGEFLVGIQYKLRQAKSLLAEYRADPR